MDSPLALPTLLSQALVAFTIEFDNEFERTMPHRTTNADGRGKSKDSPWLVSMVMWSNFLQYVPPEGISVRDLQRQARITDEGMHTSLAGMQRWGYVSVGSDDEPIHSKKVAPATNVRPTPAGAKAQGIWQPLFDRIEQRWRDRFGSGPVDALRASLQAIVDQLDADLPEYLPILRYGLFAEVSPGGGRAASSGSQPTLPALLSQVLLAYTLEFERHSEVSLAVSANFLRLLEEPVRVRDLPRRAGLSKEAVQTALGLLSKRGYATEEAESPGARVKVVTLTAKGEAARKAYWKAVGDIETRWQDRFGKQAVISLRDSLEAVVGEGDSQSPLLEGIVAPAGGWRASAQAPDGLPHHPMVLHRGGYPDGS